MPFDGLTLAAVCTEARPLLVGGRIERIQQPERLTVIVQVRNRGHKCRLLMSADAQAAAMRLTAAPFTNPPALPVFAGVLRKHLEGGRIAAVEQPGFERLVRLVVEGRSEIGLLSRKYLIAEFMGKHSNIILVDAESGVILDGIKRYTHAVSRYRQVLPGVPYQAPPNEKTDPRQLNIEEYITLITDQPLNLKLFEALQKRLEGLSLPVARELVHRCGIDLDTRLEHCGVYELHRTWEALQAICQTVTGDNPRLVTAHGPGGRVLDLAPIELTHLGGDSFESGPPNQMLDRFFTRRAEQDRLIAARSSIGSILSRYRRRLEGKARTAERIMRDRSKVDLYRTCGEVLTANLYRIEDGTSRVTLENFYTGEPLTIELDPRLSPAQNAQSYFKRYNKHKTALARAEEEIELLTAELRYLDELETSVQMAENLSDIEEIRSEMAAEGYLKEIVQSPRRSAKPASEPRRFTAPGGQAILVGRNNRQNDIVTFRLAGETDVWLHARGVPGAHVILRTEGQTHDNAALEYAARLAAYFSRARQADKVAVDYTLRRHVRKPKGAKPGFVIYTHEKTIQVSPAAPDSSPDG